MHSTHLGPYMEGPEIYEFVGAGLDYGDFEGMEFRVRMLGLGAVASRLKIPKLWVTLWVSLEPITLNHFRA